VFIFVLQIQKSEIDFAIITACDEVRWNVELYDYLLNWRRLTALTPCQPAAKTCSSP
jgi:hypothetical protein